MQKKFAFFEHVIYNSHLMDIFYNWDSCCYEVDLSGIGILKMKNACVFRFEEILLFFQIIVPDSRLDCVTIFEPYYHNSIVPN